MNKLFNFPLTCCPCPSLTNSAEAWGFLGSLIKRPSDCTISLEHFTSPGSPWLMEKAIEHPLSLMRLIHLIHAISFIDRILEWQYWKFKEDNSSPNSPEEIWRSRRLKTLPTWTRWEKSTAFNVPRGYLCKQICKTVTAPFIFFPSSRLGWHSQLHRSSQMKQCISPPGGLARN